MRIPKAFFSNRFRAARMGVSVLSVVLRGTRGVGGRKIVKLQAGPGCLLRFRLVRLPQMRNRVFAGRAFAALMVLALCGDAVAALPRLDALGRIGEMITNAVMRKDAALLASYFERRDATWEWRTEFWGKHMQAAVPHVAAAGPRRLGVPVALLNPCCETKSKVKEGKRR